MPESDIRAHEVTFCSRVAGWANALFAEHPEWPFRRAEIEQSKAIKRKRSDLRFYGDAARLILAGEVKMPGTRDGFTPYNAALVDDSAFKADANRTFDHQLQEWNDRRRKYLRDDSKAVVT